MKNEIPIIKKAFIIMPFTSEFFDYCDKIYKPALESEGYKAIHVADNKILIPINDKILDGIKNADIILCDLTNNNPNVLYELGLAHAIGKSVILLAKKGEIVPFDIANISIIFYDPNEKKWEQKTYYDIKDVINAIKTNPNSWPPPLIDPLISISDSWGLIFKTFIRVIGKKLDFPARAGFVIRFLIALAGGVIGGLLWTSIFRHGLGGSDLEPHGICAFLWGIITNIPVILALIILNMVYHFSDNKKLWKVSILFLILIGLAGWLFYDIQISSYRGFREYFMNQSLSFLTTESILVLIWSAICSLFPLFISSNFVLNKSNYIRVYKDVVLMSLLIITITSFLVILYLIILPHSPMYDAGRGIIAGVSIRTMLFFGLYNISSHIKPTERAGLFL